MENLGFEKPKSGNTEPPPKWIGELDESSKHIEKIDVEAFRNEIIQLKAEELKEWKEHIKTIQDNPYDWKNKISYRPNLELFLINPQKLGEIEAFLWQVFKNIENIENKKIKEAELEKLLVTYEKYRDRQGELIIADLAKYTIPQTEKELIEAANRLRNHPYNGFCAWLYNEITRALFPLRLENKKAKKLVKEQEKPAL